MSVHPPFDRFPLAYFTYVPPNFAFFWLIRDLTVVKVDYRCPRGSHAPWEALQLSGRRVRGGRVMGSRGGIRQKLDLGLGLFPSLRPF